MRNRPPIRLILILAGAFCFSAVAYARSDATSPDSLDLQAKSAILIEQDTGTILYQLNPDMEIPPASLTKLMTLNIALNEIEKGRLDPATVVHPVPPAWARNMPEGSSLMFIGPNQQVSIADLLKGLEVDSGNDAAYELAYVIAGSVPAFADMMNSEAARLGFHIMHFVEPSGIDARNVITAREYANFSRDFIELHPDALKDLLSLKEFTYPKASNLINGNREHPITQYNRNKLLWNYTGADGLKTGYIDESGYNIAVTAERDGMRLIAVLLGVRPTATASGPVLRTRETEQLLNYGFDRFTKLRVGYPPPSTVRVWKGKARAVSIAPPFEPVLVLPKDEIDRLKGVIEQKSEAVAPIAAGQVLGSIVYRVDGKEVGHFNLEAQKAVPAGGFFKRLADSIAIFFRRIFGLSTL